MNIENVFYDLNSRLLVIKLRLQKQILNLVNIYAPNLESEQFEYINKMYDVCANLKNIIINYNKSFRVKTLALKNIMNKVLFLKRQNQ